MAIYIIILVLVMLSGMAVMAIGFYGAWRLAKADQEVACGATGFISVLMGAILAVAGGVTISNVLEKTIIYKVVATEVIRVLDHHGIDNICKNFDCKGLTNGTAFKALEDIPGVEVSASAHPSDRN